MAFDFLSGLETGDFSEWTTTVGTVSVVTSPINSGVYAAKLSSAGSASSIKKTGMTAGATKFASIMLRVHVNSNPSPASIHGMLTFLDGTAVGIGDVQLRINADGTVDLALHNGITDTILGSYANISLDTFHLVQLKCTVSPTVGVLEWKLDGTTKQTSTSQNTGSANIEQVQIRLLTDTGSADLYVDDVGVNAAAYPARLVSLVLGQDVSAVISDNPLGRFVYRPNPFEDLSV